MYNVFFASFFFILSPPPLSLQIRKLKLANKVGQLYVCIKTVALLTSSRFLIHVYVKTFTSSDTAGVNFQCEIIRSLKDFVAAKTE